MNKLHKLNYEVGSMSGHPAIWNICWFKVLSGPSYGSHYKRYKGKKDEITLKLEISKHYNVNVNDIKILEIDDE